MLGPADFSLNITSQHLILISGQHISAPVLINKHECLAHCIVLHKQGVVLHWVTVRFVFALH